MSKFSERLKEQRQKHRLTQNDLANLLNTTAQNIAIYEKGRAVSYDNLMLLCKRFRVSSDYMLGLRDIESPDEKALSDAVSDLFGKHADDFNELLSHKYNFVRLIAFCADYIKDKGIMINLYTEGSDDIVTKIPKEQFHIRSIKRILETMAEKYYFQHPTDRKMSFTGMYDFESWEIEFLKDMIGGESDDKTT